MWYDSTSHPNEVDVSKCDYSQLYVFRQWENPIYTVKSALSKRSRDEKYETFNYETNSLIYNKT